MKHIIQKAKTANKKHPLKDAVVPISFQQDMEVLRDDLKHISNMDYEAFRKRLNFMERRWNKRIILVAFNDGKLKLYHRAG